MPKNLSPVSLTLLNSFSAVSLTPAINFMLFGYLYRQDSLIAGVVDTAGKFFAGVTSPVSLTLLIHSLAIISVNFRKKSK
jgi:hypothetical protein